MPVADIAPENWNDRLRASVLRMAQLSTPAFAHMTDGGVGRIAEHLVDPQPDPRHPPRASLRSEGARRKQTAIVAGLIAGTLMEGPAGYFAGFLFHQGIAVFAAILYALFFDIVGADDNLWLWGLIGALIHYALAGPVVAKIPSLDPETGVVGVRVQELRRARRRDVLHRACGIRAVDRDPLRTAALDGRLQRRVLSR
jgi:hypothetical protein